MWIYYCRISLIIYCEYKYIRAASVKNRYNAENLIYHQEEFGCTADWSFFQSGHGKGPVDGIGGTVKRKVLMHVYHGKAVVNSAETLAAVAKELFPKTITILMVLDCQLKVLGRWKHTKAIAGIRSAHYMKVANNAIILLSWSPFAEASSMPDLQAIQPEAHEVGKKMYDHHESNHYCCSISCNAQ